MTRKRERKIPGTFLLAAVRSGDPWCKTMVSISKFVTKDNAVVCNEEVNSFVPGRLKPPRVLNSNMDPNISFRAACMSSAVSGEISRLLCFITEHCIPDIFLSALCIIHRCRHILAHPAASVRLRTCCLSFHPTELSDQSPALPYLLL